MKKNLNDQILEMQSKLSEKGISTNDFIERLKETAFHRGYLFVTVNEEQINETKKVISNYECYTSNNQKTKESIKEKQVFLSELKAPLLFGKAKYQETVNIANNEINTLMQSLEKTQTQIDSINSLYKEAIGIKKRLIDEITRNELQYNNDEIIFEKEKKKIISTTAKQICDLPESHVMDKWEDVKDYFKKFLKKSPENHLFPLVGWELAFEHSVKIALHYYEWQNDESILILEEHTHPFKKILLNFISKYIENITTHHHPLYYSVKGVVLFEKIKNTEVINFLFQLKETLPDRYEIACRTVIDSNKENIGTLLKELFASIEIQRGIAIQAGDENILNNVVREHERYYGELLGWLKPCLI